MSFIEENDQTAVRRAHLETLRQIINTNAYPNRFRRSQILNPPQPDTITGVLETYLPRVLEIAPQTASGARPTPEQAEELNAKLNPVRVALAGRIAVPPRVMGKAAFVHLSDGNARLQIYVRKDDARLCVDEKVLDVDAWEVFKTFDHGDFIGVRGYLFTTKTGELSVHVEEFEFLSKALLPMPDKLHGITDAELRVRRRYVDLIAGALRVELKDEVKKGNEKASASQSIEIRSASANHTTENTNTSASDDEAAHEAHDDLTARQVFERRARLIREMRNWLDAREYIEVETPMLAPLASGAAARPFVTHHNALAITLYARIAPELYLKRLLVGGFERVYELNRNFRNEGIDRTHNPEFTMLEFYAAYMDAKGMIETCEEILRASISQALAARKSKDAHGKDENNTSLIVEWNNHKIDFSQPFAQMTMTEAIGQYMPDELREALGFSPLSLAEGKRKSIKQYFEDSSRVRRLAAFINIYETQSVTPLVDNPTNEIGEADSDTSEREARIEMLREAWANFENGAADVEIAIDDLEASESASGNVGDEASEAAALIQNMFETLCEQSLIQPTFITDFPKAVSPLAKANTENPTLAERFELYIGGMEIANGFSELNDPEEQQMRFIEQQRAGEQGDAEAMALDEDYLRALAYAMPPAAGLGIGIDRVAMLITNRRSIRDVILFPHLRPETKIEEAAEQTD